MRHRLELIGLVGALLAIAGFVTYMLWPPSAETLYKKAEALMASSDRHDWDVARDEYFDVLDRKHPDHPYKEQTRTWREKILFTDAENRAAALASPVKTSLTKPRTENETLLTEYQVQVAAAEKAQNDLGAAELWKRFGTELKANDADAAKWQLYAKRKADELTQTVAKRRETVQKLIEKVAEAMSAGRLGDAMALRTEILSKFGGYSDLADLIRILQGANPQGGGETPGTPNPAVPPSNPAQTPTPDPGAAPGKTGP